MPDDELVGRNIPAAIKRAVRQRCGFGCVICGIPIFHYDHIEEFSIIGSHSEENITLLCPIHHDSKTRRQISKSVITRANENPVNKVGDGEFTRPWARLIDANNAKFIIGSCLYKFDLSKEEDYFPAIIYGSKEKVALGLGRDNDYAYLDVKFVDADGGALLSIVNGGIEISQGVWDYEIVGKNIKIRQDLGNVALELNLIEDGVEVVRGNIFCPPENLKIEDGRLFFSSGSSLSGFVFRRKYGVVVNPKMVCYEETALELGNSYFRKVLDTIGNCDRKIVRLNVEGEGPWVVRPADPAAEEYYFVIICDECTAPVPLLDHDVRKGAVELIVESIASLHSYCRRCGNGTSGLLKDVISLQWPADDASLGDGRSWLRISISDSPDEASGKICFPRTKAMLENKNWKLGDGN